MANMRVHELAKEFGMENKELLEHLQALKIPAKSHSSTLQDAYIDMIRLKLKPVLKERAAQIEAAKKAEQERLEAEEREAAMQAEKERLEAEERARLRREEEARRKKEAEEAAAAEARAREEEERLRREEEERNRIKDTAPTVSKSYDSLLDKIAAEESRMAQEREQKQEARKQEARKPKERQTPAPLPVSEPSHSKGAKRKKGKKESVDIEERKPRRDQESERFVKSKVLAEAREAVLRARDTEDTGRRKKRKEKRAKEEAERREKEAIEQAKAQGINPAELGTVRISEGSTVAEVAEAIGVAPNDIIKRLFLLGTPLTLTQSMSNDLIELVASDLEVEVKILTPQEEATFTFYDEPDTLLHRPPVVTVMGHVDHGKTSLLDAIRQTGVVKSEAGGITQHIGASIAYINNKQITFIDTPGHEAFTAMRARGAKITDIVILVVAADDGVMPQTIEAINHSKAAGVPVIVAVNKCDKPSANPERVRKELVDHGVIPEDWGGDNMFVDVSAKKEMGIDDLLESVLLQAEVLELKANPNTFASGYVIEAKLDKGRGPVATMLVNRGTLRVGDAVVAGTSYGRVRALLGPNGEHLSEITPANPAEVLGLDSVPAAGDEFRVFEDERDARALAEERSFKQRLAAQNRTKKHVTLETLFDHVSQEELKDLNIIVKADVQGSIEALADALSKMDQSEVRINIIHAAVGGVTETDVSLATASNAIIIGFNVRPSRGAKDAAEKEDVEIRTYRVIYQAIDDINAARVGMLAPTIEERDTGVAEVRETFKVPRVGTIGGCYITEGEIARDNKIRVVRNGAVVFEGTLASLKRFKEDVKSVRAGYECGIGVEGYQDIKVGDLIEGYEVVEVARKE